MGKVLTVLVSGCQMCDINSAVVECRECDKYFCSMCDSYYHLDEKSNHLRLPIAQSLNE